MPKQEDASLLKCNKEETASNAGQFSLQKAIKKVPETTSIPCMAISLEQ